MTTTFCIGINAFTVPNWWIDEGKWKVYFYYRKWPSAYNDNDIRWR